LFSVDDLSVAFSRLADRPRAQYEPAMLDLGTIVEAVNAVVNQREKEQRDAERKRQDAERSAEMERRHKEYEAALAKDRLENPSKYDALLGLSDAKRHAKQMHESGFSVKQMDRAIYCEHCGHVGTPEGISAIELRELADAVEQYESRKNSNAQVM
jgi:hypothetical protein